MDLIDGRYAAQRFSHSECMNSDSFQLAALKINQRSATVERILLNNFDARHDYWSQKRAQIECHFFKPFDSFMTNNFFDIWMTPKCTRSNKFEGFVYADRVTSPSLPVKM